jgi:hypothetical protein
MRKFRVFWRTEELFCKHLQMPLDVHKMPEMMGFLIPVGRVGVDPHTVEVTGSNPVPPIELPQQFRP